LQKRNHSGGMVVKAYGSKFVAAKAAVLALAFVLCGSGQPAYCQTNRTVLLLQKTPPQGGMITPKAGIHSIDIDTNVILTAIPKPGYQFVYWLGNVSDQTANRTIVYLGAPKIVIAVFERAEYDFLVVEDKPQSSFGGGSGLSASARDYSNQGYWGGGGGYTERGEPRFSEKPPKSDDLPVPKEEEEEDEFPVPVPEPATAVLLVLGSLYAFARPKKT